MANSTSTQLLVDGPVHCVVKFEGVLDTADLTSTVVIDPSTLSTIDGRGTPPTKLRIDKIIHNIEDQLSVNLFWDATTPVRIEELVGRGKQDHYHWGGLKNNAGTYNADGSFTPAAGFTGKITATTQGWSASAVLSFSIILHCIKQ